MDNIMAVPRALSTTAPFAATGLVGPAGVGFPNENNELIFPTPPKRGFDLKEKTGRFPNPPNRPTIADTPPGRWWLLGLEYPPEAADPALDRWLAGDPCRYFPALGMEAGDA